jgi:hypothetical protein
LSALAAVLALLACSSTRSVAPAEVKASILTVRNYANSFNGLSAEAVRSRLAGTKIIEEDWKEGEFGGKQLVATFPDYELRVLFLEDRVITTSIQVLSE